MAEIGTELSEKKRQLEELIKSRSKASCSSKNSSKADVDRETLIEELEEEIQDLEKQVQTAG